MGSMITLGIGCMEIDWGKNNVFLNHSSLFKLSDVKLVPYYYVDMNTDELIIEMKEGYERKLSSIKNRLDLLGYNIASIKRCMKSYYSNMRAMAVISDCHLMFSVKF